jgi:hypothetical protein
LDIGHQSECGYRPLFLLNLVIWLVMLTYVTESVHKTTPSVCSVLQSITHRRYRERRIIVVLENAGIILFFSSKFEKNTIVLESLSIKKAPSYNCSGTNEEHDYHLPQGRPYSRANCSGLDVCCCCVLFFCTHFPRHCLARVRLCNP